MHLTYKIIWKRGTSGHPSAHCRCSHTWALPASLLSHTPLPFPRARTQQPHWHARLLPVCLAKTVGLAFFLARDQGGDGELNKPPAMEAAHWPHTGVSPPGNTENHGLGQR